MTSTISALLELSAAGLAICIAPAIASAQTRGNIRFVDAGTSQAYLARIYQPNLASTPTGYLPPAVVLMHGCSGMWSNSVAPTVTCSGSTCTVSDRNAQSHIEKWGRHLATQGYIALALDGFTTRADNSQNHCGESPPYDPLTEVDPYTTRADDFYIAKDFLINNFSANPTGVGELGWSHGAEASLVNAAATPRNSNATCGTPAACDARAEERPTAVVVFYPGCGANLGYGYTNVSNPGYWRPDVPMRWNHGEADGTTAFAPCEARVDEALTTYSADIDFDSYASVDHSFDINTTADDGALFTFPTAKCNAESLTTMTKCARWDADIDSLAFIMAEIHGSFPAVDPGP